MRATRSSTVDVLSLAFGTQREAIGCHAPLVALCCSGRSGKTRGAVLKWLEVAERKPGQLAAFVALTLKQARRTAWAQLRRLNKELKLGLSFNKGELIVSHPNGSELHLLGTNRDDLIDVLRGSPFAFVYLDEVAFFREGLVKQLVDDVLIIRMMDLDGELWIGSTPGYVEAGYHYDAITSAGAKWRTFHWTYLDNPHLPELPWDPDAGKRLALRQKKLLDVREQFGWGEDSPSFVREWLGRYCRDAAALVYAFDRQIHFVDEMPESWRTHRERWTVVLGMDFGSTNATAWVLWAFEKHSPIAYCLSAFKHYNMAPSECAAVTRVLVDSYHPDVIVGDSAAKGYIDDHRVLQQVEIKGADKLGKRAHQMSMNDAWRFQKAGAPAPRIRLLRGATEEYASELERLGKDPRFKRVVGEDGKVTAHPRHGEESPLGEKDLCDAGLYGWWECWTYIEEYERQEAEARAKAEAAAADPLGATALRGLHAKAKPTRHAGLRGAFGVGSLPKRRG